MSNFRYTSALFFLFAFITYQTSAQNEIDLVSKYKNALQKSADDSKLRTLEINSTFFVKQINVPAKIYYKSPYCLRLEINFMNLKFLQILNDSLEWSYDPFNNKHKIEHKTKKAGISSTENNTFSFKSDNLLNHESLGYPLKLEGKQKVDSLDVFVLELTTNKEKKLKTTYFLNSKTFLIYKIQDEKGVWIFANYTNEDGFIFPKYIRESKLSGAITEINFLSFKINGDVQDSLFVIPKVAFHRALNDPRSSLFKKAQQSKLEQKYDSAQYYYSLIIKQHPDNYNAYNERGLLHIAMQEYYDAISDFNRALELGADPAVSYNNRGLAKFNLNDFDGALKDYGKALQINSALTIAYKNRGEVYLAKDEDDLAEKDFAVAIKLNPLDGDAYYRLGIAQAELEKYKEAITSYNIAITKGYTESRIFNYKGVSEFNLEKYDSALISFKIALEGEPENVQFIENLGRTFYEIGNYEEASKQFHKCLDQSDDPDIHNLIGLCKYNEEEFKGAIKSFSKAIELNVKNATYYDNRAAAKEMIEDYDGAISDYSESIRIYPNDASVFYKRGLIKILTSKKIEGCLDLATANEMQYKEAKDEILKNCN